MAHFKKAGMRRPFVSQKKQNIFYFCLRTTLLSVYKFTIALSETSWF